MIDDYLLSFIIDYLKLCKRCNRYDICNNEKLCCICGDFFAQIVKQIWLMFTDIIKVNIIFIVIIILLIKNNKFTLIIYYYVYMTTFLKYYQELQFLLADF